MYFLFGNKLSCVCRCVWGCVCVQCGKAGRVAQDLAGHKGSFVKEVNECFVNVSWCSAALQHLCSASASNVFLRVRLSSSLQCERSVNLLISSFMKSYITFVLCWGSDGFWGVLSGIAFTNWCICFSVYVHCKSYQRDRDWTEVHTFPLMLHISSTPVVKYLAVITAYLFKWLGNIKYHKFSAETAQ